MSYTHGQADTGDSGAPKNSKSFVERRTEWAIQRVRRLLAPIISDQQGRMHSILDFAHELAAGALERGDVAVDATVGNGHDTVALARAVGAEGRVFGFDVQAEAIESTRARLGEQGLLPIVDLVHAGHEQMPEHLPGAVQGAVGAVTFNLGYLPGGASDLTTSPNTTLPALRAATAALRPGGVVTVVLYTGHDGGPAEAEAVDAWAAELPQARFRALSYQFVNQQNDPPRLVAVEKREE